MEEFKIKESKDNNIPEEQIQYVELVPVDRTYEASSTEQSQNNLIDIQQQSSLGNFIPYLYGLKYNYLTTTELDKFGYGVIHHAVAFNNIQVTVALIEKYQQDVNCKSSIQQTPIMIASNYGFIKVAKYLFTKGANLDLSDDMTLNCLLYAIKNNRNWMTIYLLSIGADINCKDLQGRGVVHWAAYVNNTFLLEIFGRLGMNLLLLDEKGHSPFIKAIFNDAYDTIQYYLENVEDSVPEFLLIDKIKSPSIKQMIKQHLTRHKIKNLYLFQLLDNNRKVFAQIFLLFAVSSIYFSYVAGALAKLSTQGFINILNIVMNSLVFIYVPLLFYFIGKFSSTKNYFFDNKNNQIQQNKEFQILNQLLKQSSNNQEEEEQEAVQIQLEYTFLHKIVDQVTNNKFQELEQTNPDQICVPCLKFRSERMQHCKKCGICVEKFNHHSYFFERCISRGQNHKMYYLLLSAQQFGLFLFLFLNWNAYWNKLDAWKIFFFIEIPYIMYFNDNAQFGFWVTFGFLLSLLLFFQNSIEWVIETHGIINNLTRYEIFNREKCWYFFIQIFQDNNGNTFRIYKNYFSKGIIKNISEYITGEAAREISHHNYL